jgi:NADPH:quinone reductase-like Zn-dependent oxidoreductase
VRGVGANGDAASKRMRAAVQRRYGPPEVMRVEEIDRPEIAADEILVRVRATTVNRTDCGYRGATPFLIRGVAGLRRPRHLVGGTELAGDVAAVGEDVAAFAVGDRVFAYVEGTFGAHAEYAAVPASGPVALIPDGVSYTQAAPATEGAHYAMSFIRWSKVGAGRRVLVYGATGAIGSAAVQLLRTHDVAVTAVCGTEHVELVRSLGAERVVDYQREDYTRDEQRYDAVFDAVGKTTFWRCRHLLVPRGVYLSSELGPGAQNPVLSLVTPLLRGRRVRFPLPSQNQPMVLRLAQLLEDGAFRPVIDRTYALEEIVDAFAYVETGQKVGNVVITTDPA